METATPTRPAPERLPALLRAVDLQALAAWLLGFLLVAYLGLDGGGYDPIVRDQLGIAIWWGVLLGLAVGALPLNRLRYGSWVALGLLAAYVAWVALSATWSTGPERAFADLGRVTTLLGVFALALSIRGRRGARRMIGALAAGIFVVTAVALLSRLHPAWFPDAGETATFLTSARNRLSYPLGYWNGVASLAAIGLPLLLYLAGSARHILTRALAAAALPAMVLTIYFTFSRGGSIAALLAAVLFLALAHDRLPKLATTLIAAAGGAVLIAAASQRDALDAGLANDLAHSQGDELLTITLAVCAGAGLLQAGLALALRPARRPAWSRPSPRFSLVALGATVAIAVIAALALDAPGEASSAWQEFREARGTPQGAARFGSFSSNGRVPYWESTLDQNATAPLRGTGSGSFEPWWAQNGTISGFVEDAHSLYLETLGELGIVGLSLLVGFVGWILAMGGRAYLRAKRASRTQLAAALAGCAAFCLAAGADWLWELAVIPIAFLLLASVLVSAGEGRRRAPLPLPIRAGGIVLALAAMIAIAIPLTTASSLQKSQAAARDGDFAQALQKARDAQRVEPFAAIPHLQEALILEAQGRLAPAEVAIRTASRRGPDEWRVWLIRSRIEAERGKAAAAIASYRKARSLNPNSPLFG